MSDRIVLKNIVVHGFHGVHPEEKRLGQRFEIDLICATDTRPAGASDDYEKAICYESLFKIAEKTATKERFQLLEALAEAIAARILDGFSAVEEVGVTVRKPQAPIAGIFDHVAVEIWRRRND